MNIFKSKQNRIALYIGIIGSLIAAFVLWLLDYLIPLITSVWNIILLSYNFLLTGINIPLWLLILLIIYFMNRIRKFTLALKIDSGNDTVNYDTIINSLTRKELDILDIFYRNQGTSIDMYDLSLKINANKLELDQVLDDLANKRIVNVVKNFYSGTSYHLTKLGRDIILEIKHST